MQCELALLSELSHPKLVRFLGASLAPVHVPPPAPLTVPLPFSSSSDYL